jgi:hypothetical protein
MARGKRAAKPNESVESGPTRVAVSLFAAANLLISSATGYSFAYEGE